MQWYNPVYNWQLVAQAHDRYLLEDLGVREWAFVEPQSGAMLAFKSFMQLNYSVAHKVVSSPVESSFVAYNKTTDPEQLDIRGAIKGTPEEIGDALDTLIYFAQSTELLNILTPEKYYIGFNLYKLDYKRDARDGVDLVIFDARLQEIRQVRWPNRKETWKLTFAVIGYVAIAAICLGLLDALLKLAFNKLIGGNM